MLIVYLAFAVLFVLIAVAIAGGITMAMERKRQKRYEKLAEEKLKLDRERLEFEKSKVEDKNG